MISSKVKTSKKRHIGYDIDGNKADDYIFSEIKIEMSFYSKGDKGTEFILSFRKIEGDYFIYKEFLEALALRLLLP